MAIIPICRGTKSGGKATAECLAERLGYPILGREVIQEAAAELGVSADLLEEELCERPTVWSRFSSMRRVYTVAVQCALAEHALEGNLVYHGLAGGLLLRDAPATMCMRLIAPLDRRIDAVMRESEMDQATAEQYIRDMDESRSRWVRAMYGEDVTDPSLYDLVINLETLTVEAACAIAARVVDQPEFAVTEDAKAGLRDFLTACRVKLALVSDAEMRTLELDARADGGVATITGEAPVLSTGRTGERILEIARGVPGVDEVLLNVDWYDPYP